MPDGFERIVTDDGEELVQPTPARAVADLFEILNGIPTWERFPDDPGDWAPSQVRERGRPMPGYVLVTGVDERGERCRVELGDDSPVVRVWVRLEAARRSRWHRDQTRAIEREWESTVSEWEGLSGRRFPRTAPKFRRSPIEGRRQMVRGLRTGLDLFVPQAIVAVVAAGGNAAPLRQLERDEELCADTVAAAMVELRRLTAPEAKVDKPEAKLPIDVMHDRVCVAIRKALSSEPSGLLLKALVARCGGDQKRTTIKNRLKLMEDVEQTGNRGAYRLAIPGVAQPRRH